MELKGPNLGHFKKQQGKHFGDLQAVDILLQIIDAIEGVHQAGLIHRDIKPVSDIKAI